MPKIKLYIAFVLFFISGVADSTEVITPGFILLNITEYYKTVEKLESHWAISGSEFELSNIKIKEEYLKRLNLLINIEPKSIVLGSSEHENITQIVQTRKGKMLEVIFKYREHKYDKNALLNFAGDYSFVSVSLVKPIHEVKKYIQNEVIKTSGYIVKKYICSPCPPDNYCKPCMHNNIVISEHPNSIDSYSSVGNSEIVLFYKDTSELILGRRYLFRFKVANRATKELNLLSFERINY